MDKIYLYVLFIIVACFYYIIEITQRLSPTVFIVYGDYIKYGIEYTAFVLMAVYMFGYITQYYKFIKDTELSLQVIRKGGI